MIVSPIFERGHFRKLGMRERRWHRRRIRRGRAEFIAHPEDAMGERVCEQPSGLGTVAENRRCVGLAVPGWKVCALHLSLLRGHPRLLEKYRLKGEDDGSKEDRDDRRPHA